MFISGQLVTNSHLKDQKRASNIQMAYHTVEKEKVTGISSPKEPQLLGGSSRYFWTVKIREQSIPRNSVNDVTLILRRRTTVNVSVRVTVHSHFLNF